MNKAMTLFAPEECFGVGEIGVHETYILWSRIFGVTGLELRSIERKKFFPPYRVKQAKKTLNDDDDDELY